jgi:hypothetical protein
VGLRIDWGQGWRGSDTSDTIHFVHCLMLGVALRVPGGLDVNFLIEAMYSSPLMNQMRVYRLACHLFTRS